MRNSAAIVHKSLSASADEALRRRHRGSLADQKRERLQPILTDDRETIHNQGKENYAVLAMIVDKSNPVQLFPAVLDAKAPKNGMGDTSNRMQ
jgi:hypothetical protein